MKIELGDPVGRGNGPSMVAGEGGLQALGWGCLSTDVEANCGCAEESLVTTEAAFLRHKAEALLPKNILAEKKKRPPFVFTVSLLSNKFSHSRKLDFQYLAGPGTRIHWDGA